jgi:RNA polymerase sigma-70 factor (ECF subfamily)
MAFDFQRLYRTHAQALFAFSLSVTGHEADTYDLLQELFQKITAKPELLAGVKDERAFLIRILHNMAKDLQRRRQTRQKNWTQFSLEQTSLFAPSEDPDEEICSKAMDQAMEELPEEQRLVVHLKLWEGLTFEVIAEVLDITLNTAASRYRYGLDKLRERLRPLYEELKNETRPL